MDQESAVRDLSAGQIKIKDLFNYELSPIPTALFKDTGEGRYPTSNATLKNELKEEVSVRNVHPDAVIIDGCAMLHGAPGRRRSYQSSQKLHLKEIVHI